MSSYFRGSVLPVLALLSPALAGGVDTQMITGNMTVSTDQIASLDLGRVNSVGDLALMTPGVLLPQGDAMAVDNAGTGSSFYDSLDVKALMALNNYASAPFTYYQGDVVALHTLGGHWAKLLFTAVGSSSATFQYTTYWADPGPPFLKAFPTKLRLDYSLGSSFGSKNFTMAGSGLPEGYKLYPLFASKFKFYDLSTSSGMTPSTVSLLPKQNISIGLYYGAVFGQSTAAPITNVTIPVTVNVTSKPTVYFDPPNVTFVYTEGATAPPSDECVWFTASGPSQTFQFATSDSRLSVTPTSGATPVQVKLSLNPAGFNGVQGPTTFNFSVTAASSGGQTLSVPVNVIVSPSPTAPVVTTLVDAASQVSGPVTPGEIITLYGSNIGPSTPLSFSLTSAGTVPITLGDSRVLFGTGSNVVEAPLTYVGPNQINAIVPNEVGSQPTVPVFVSTPAGVSNSLPLVVLDTSGCGPTPSGSIRTSPFIAEPCAGLVPAVFTLNGAGNGPAAALNQDGTVNGPANPAAPGSIIQLYGTGLGPTSPQLPTGSVTPTTSPFPMVLAPVTVTIGGEPAPIIYAGAAPGLVAGAVQVNVKVPNLSAGPYLTAVSVGSTPNPQPQSVLVFTGGVAEVP